MDAMFIRGNFLLPSSLAIMKTWGKKDDTNYYGYGIQQSYIRGNDFGIGHKGRDLGYSANAFLFPVKGGDTYIFCELRD